MTKINKTEQKTNKYLTFLSLSLSLLCENGAGAIASAPFYTTLVMLKSLNIYLVLQLLCLDLGLNVTIFSPCNSRTKEYKCKEVVSKNL